MVEILVIGESVMTNVHTGKDSNFFSLIEKTLENMQRLKSICEQLLLFHSF